ncbi:uncharacterized acetyltransferase At3g50280-like [Rutidosis leptorrhynchoides]|uniref:uncharacterized acetyltransferase At3g50280-like n=1 Tax=Rutidosis leptorrhynchoides TaxID=125765 RepID=UPI003A999F57
MTSPTVRLISECLVKPLHDLSSNTKQPIYFTPFELLLLNANYSQKGLLFDKPSKNQRFSIAEFLDKLQHTLSATLTHFYPLAARLGTRKQQNPPPNSYVIYIDPENSPGAKFIYAKADANISDVISSVCVPLLVHSLFDLNNNINHDGHTFLLLSIQVTELNDGIFIGGSVNHMVADGTSFWNFMATWSEIFRSQDQILPMLEEASGSINISRPPVFKRVAFEGCDHVINLPYTHPDEFIERFRFPHLLEERFFDFSATSISKLKAKENVECKTQKISSLQAVSALLWRCVTRARHLPKKADSVCKLAIKNRHRLDPPLSDNYFGNHVQIVRGTTTVEDLITRGLGRAALILHEAVRKHDDIAVKKWAQSWSKTQTIIKMSKVFDPNAITIGSSPRFDMYGCEFGLGKAVATRSGCSNKADGQITMYPGRNGGGSMGIEVCLLSEYMRKIECDEEFISALASN